MARPRTSIAQARITGALHNHPSRFKDRADPALAPLGGPPPWLTSPQKQAWLAFQHELPWLTEADRCLCELASRLRAWMLDEKDPPLGCLNLLRRCISMLGATPGDRSKIAAPAGAGDDNKSRHFVE